MQVFTGTFQSRFHNPPIFMDLWNCTPQNFTPAQVQWCCDRFIHPRVGERFSKSRPVPVQHSSPRARGTRLIKLTEARSSLALYLSRARGTYGRGVGELLVPTVHPRGAGNTNKRRRGSSGRVAVHPRGRGGEHRIARGRRTSLAGSSPRGAGNTTHSHCSSWPASVHPRGREGTLMPEPYNEGDHLRFIPAGAGNTPSRPCQSLDIVGSSPQARGTRLSRHRDLPLFRFTPAQPQKHQYIGAGNSFIAGWKKNVVYGSSPQARGTRSRADDFGLECRFIPAGAGTHRRACSSAYRDRFIPAGAGELCRILNDAKGDYGSSPPGAGNSPWSTVTLRTPSVHPRGRGEHSA